MGILEKLREVRINLYALSAFLICVAILVGVHNCGPRRADSGSISKSDRASEFLTSTGTTVHSPSNGPKHNRNTESTLPDVDERNEPATGSNDPISGWVGIESTRNSPTWSSISGELVTRRFSLGFAPGIQATLPKALGLDARIARAWDFGFNVGGMYYFDDKKLADTFSLGYNLRKTKVLSNVDIIFGYSIVKEQTFVGIRIELGQYK